ncbi:metallophosphoesterase [Hugenholtzia roseola]|uniref:metallophosphoesterase n=1 Tax=Hugenholtzia roseola TaxID=1002 RepID=UPI0004129ACC|nr:metallophosphoesterase [Hugenholtzia roseola]
MRKFAIGDVHGCGKTLIHLVENVLEITPQDSVYLLGDVIDRGKNVVLALDWILEKRQAGYQIITLMGNHEEMLLENLAQAKNEEIGAEKRLRYWLKKNYLEAFFDKDFNFLPKYESYFQSLLPYVELESYILVHAGLDLKGETLYDNKKALFWNRNFKNDLSKTNNKTVLFGHSVHGLEQIKAAIEDQEPQIPLDNGCVYVNLEKYHQLCHQEIGFLCAFEMESRRLFYTPCLDK